MTRMTVAEMAESTLAECDVALTQLHDLCCVPNRSPRMRALQDTLSGVRAMLPELETDPESGDEIIGQLLDAGSEIGRLQIECCAPGRMPLYADLLGGLSRVQRMITSAQGGMDH